MKRTTIGCSIFFRAKSYRLATLYATWQRYVLSQEVAVEVEQRCVLLGDHTHVVKDGGHMPGVVSMRELSETQRKPSYFRGQCWGGIGLVVGTVWECFCLPLELRIHQGFVHLNQAPEPRSSLGERVVAMALACVLSHDRPAWLILDAFFPTAKVFRLARSVDSITLKAPYLQLLIRAKKNYVAYFPAPPKAAHRRGPQPRYGEKVHLWECFDHRHLFDSVDCQIYGQRETVQVMALPLLWKPLGEWLLFIFAITSRGRLVLMSSDLTLSPATALELYCLRTRIETMFDMMKNLLQAFRFRFWTKKLPRHPRRPRTNRQLQAPAAEQLDGVQSCWNAYETFVLCATIAQGLLQLIALRFGETIWLRHTLYLRTRSRALPSERTVKQVLAPRLLKQIVLVPQNSLLAKIQQLFVADEDDDHDDFHQAA